MFQLFHSIIGKIAASISGIALFFSGTVAPSATQQATQDTTSSTQVTQRVSSTTELSETQQLRKEVDDLKKQINTNGQSTKGAGASQSSAPTAKPQPAGIIPNPAPVVQPQPAVSTQSPDYKPQLFELLNAVKENDDQLINFARGCAAMASQRKAALESLAADRTSWLQSIALNYPVLLDLQTATYNTYDMEITEMEAHRVFCGTTYLNYLNDDIKKTDALITAVQNSKEALTLEKLQNFQSALIAKDNFGKSKTAIQAEIDRMSKVIQLARI